MCESGDKRSTVIALMLRLAKMKFFVNVTMQLVFLRKQGTTNNYRSRVKNNHK